MNDPRDAEIGELRRLLEQARRIAAAFEEELAAKPPQMWRLGSDGPLKPIEAE